MINLNLGRASFLAALLTALVGCGGSDRGTPQTPDPAPTPAPRAWIAGTTISIVSGEDFAPVEGALVILGGREYTSDGAGHVELGEDVPYGSYADVVASGFLNRQTVVPRDGRTRFVLWPRQTANGMHETFTAEIVYTYAWREEPDHGSSPLERVPESAARVSVWPSEQILQDPAAAHTHEVAIAEMNLALEGRTTYVLTPTRPATGVVLETRVAEPDDEGCEGNVAGYFRARVNARGEIGGGQIVYCTLEISRSSTVTHELGHSVGLQHSYGGNELMSRPRMRNRRVTFSEREGLAMRLLFERPAGNRFPDTDREATASAEGVHTTICY